MINWLDKIFSPRRNSKGGPSISWDDYGPIKEVTDATFADFVKERPYAVLHLDANWDGYFVKVHQSMVLAEKQFRELVSFGRLDIDESLGVPTSLEILNIPAVAYYKDGQLIKIVMGNDQDIVGAINKLTG